jgi:hypothetical protein
VFNATIRGVNLYINNLFLLIILSFSFCTYGVSTEELLSSTSKVTRINVPGESSEVSIAEQMYRMSIQISRFSLSILKTCNDLKEYKLILSDIVSLVQSNGSILSDNYFSDNNQKALINRSGIINQQYEFLCNDRKHKKINLRKTEITSAKIDIGTLLTAILNNSNFNKYGNKTIPEEVLNTAEYSKYKDVLIRSKGLICNRTSIYFKEIKSDKTLPRLQCFKLKNLIRSLDGSKKILQSANLSEPSLDGLVLTSAYDNAYHYPDEQNEFIYMPYDLTISKKSKNFKKTIIPVFIHEFGHSVFYHNLKNQKLLFQIIQDFKMVSKKKLFGAKQNIYDQTIMRKFSLLSEYNELFSDTFAVLLINDLDAISTALTLNNTTISHAGNKNKVSSLHRSFSYDGNEKSIWKSSTSLHNLYAPTRYFIGKSFKTIKKEIGVEAAKGKILKAVFDGITSEMHLRLSDDKLFNLTGKSSFVKDQHDDLIEANQRLIDAITQELDI